MKILTFELTHDAIMAEKILKKTVKIQVMPIPRSLSSSCGVAISFPPEKTTEVEQILKEAQIDFTITDIDG